MRDKALIAMIFGALCAVFARGDPVADARARAALALAGGGTAPCKYKCCDNGCECQDAHKVECAHDKCNCGKAAPAVKADNPCPGGAACCGDSCICVTAGMFACRKRGCGCGVASAAKGAPAAATLTVLAFEGATVYVDGRAVGTAERGVLVLRSEPFDGTHEYRVTAGEVTKTVTISGGQSLTVNLRVERGGAAPAYHPVQQFAPMPALGGGRGGRSC